MGEKEDKAAEVELKAKQKIIDYHMTFDTEHGKRVLADLRRESGYDRYSKLKKGHDNHTDIYAEIFDKGSQYIVARMIAFTIASPDKDRKEIKNA